jgi:hypothetical protein
MLTVSKTMILLALSATRTVSAFTAPSHRLLLPKWTRLYSSLGTTATSFDDGKRPFQITTPIYYVNDKPHIGHAYTSIGKLHIPEKKPCHL